MRVVILAGGKGTRLYPYTAVFPKPLVPIGDKPILEILIRRLQSYGFKQVTLCVGHLATLIQAYFGDGKWLGVNIDYSLEHKPLGTVGPLKLIKNLPNTFLVANGDLLTDINFKKMISFHRKQKALLTVGVYKRLEKIDLGVLEVKDQEVIDYTEKPTKEFLISAGLYMFDKKILNLIPAGKYLDFPHLVTTLITKKQKVAAYLIENFWLDIGRPDDYQKAIDLFSSNEKNFLKNAK